jgi:2-oxoisovalerate dehydrogenase E2 component (dihydrolipoyl transacylase)
MSTYSMRLHDVGEGVAEAEIVEWKVDVGDTVTSDDVVAEVMSDKATIELYSPVDGTITWRGGDVGDVVAVGSELLRFELNGHAEPVGTPPPADTAEPSDAHPAVERSAPDPAPPSPAPPSPTPPSSAPPSPAPHPAIARLERGSRTLAAPAVRARAKALGIDLTDVEGSGPDGRIVHADLDSLLTAGTAGTAAPVAPVTAAAPVAGTDDDAVEPVKVIGLRRNIAERMQAAKRRIPHFSYVEEVDVTELERLRRELNDTATDGRHKLTVLPFIMRAVVQAVRHHPEVNARFDDEAGVINRHHAVHLGIAVQTARGLMVPVVRSAGSLDLWQSADAIVRLSQAARTGKIRLDELTGSTITITSLGALGGVVTTPVINAPEVAIVGVNKIETRPVYRDGALVPRQMMNLSSSFDHRVVDGADAAEFIQDVKRLLETPALLWADPTS